MAPSVTEDQDQRDNAGLEDLTTMTIESLRARLLSERAISKSSRHRADELARRVLELEEQLRMVSIQRKKAERATADVLAILESNGISDASDAYYSNSEPETISDSKANGDAIRRKESSSNLEVGRSDMEACSSSEIESSPSTGRSLSWKSSKDSEHSHQKTKYVETARRRSSTFTSNGTSFPKRVGKSCRRIRRRESRVAAEQMHNDANKHEFRGSAVDTSLKDSPTCSNIKHTVNNGVNVAPEASVTGSPGVKGANGYYADRHAKNEDINGTLQCQAQFIGQFEVEEKAQREWEEKVRENNGSMLDSCDPGNRSDVTEERDEMKASDQLNPKVTSSTERLGSNNPEVTQPSFTEQLEPKVAKYVTGPSHTDCRNSSAQQSSSLVASCSPSTGTQSPVLSGDLDKTPSPSSHISSISNGSSKDSESSATHKELALVPEKPSHDLESVLGALQKAKLSLNQKLQGLPSSEFGSSGKNTDLSGIRPREKMEMPSGFPGLFRLPTDFQSVATARVNPGISYEEGRSSLSLGDQSYGSSPTPYSNLQFYNHSSSPFTETRLAGFPPGVSGPHPSAMPFMGRPHPSAMPFVETPHSPAMPLGKFRSGSHAFDTSPSSSGRSSYVDPQMNHGSGRFGYVDPQLDQGRSGYVDSQMNNGPGRSGHVDPQMNHGPGRSGYVDPHINRGLVLPRELEGRNGASYPDVTPQVFKDRFSRYVANSENGFSFYNDHFRPNA